MVSKGFRFGLINQWYRRRKLWTHLLASRDLSHFLGLTLTTFFTGWKNLTKNILNFIHGYCVRNIIFSALLFSAIFDSWSFSLRSEGTSLDFFVIVRTANLLKDFWKRHNFSGTRYRGSRRSSASQGQEILIKFYWVCVNISDFFPITSRVPSFS